MRELPSSIDQNFKLDTAGGSFVLKISNSDELPEYLAAQIRALEHLAGNAGSALRVPEVVHCSDGGLVVMAGEHPAWLVTWLTGTPIARLASRPPGLLRALGRALGELDGRLADFDDPAVHREFRWDLMQAPAILALAGNIADAYRRDLVHRRLRRFEAEVIPRLAQLPFQVVHNDANDHNVLVCPAGGPRFEPCGLLDFGDMMWTPRVCEPAIAMTYALLGPGAPVEACRALLSGYQESLPLGAEEIEVLPDLIEARLCVSVTISAYERMCDPNNVFVSVSEAPAWRILDWLVDDPGALRGRMTTEP